MTIVESEQESVSPASARQLIIIASAMGAGLTFMAGLVAWTYVNAAATPPSPGMVRSVNSLTAAVMVFATLAILASEFAWRAALRRTPGALGARVQTAFIVRMALREGAGLLGLTAGYIAAVGGVLRVYPAYWVALVPYAWFLVFLALHWPTADKLSAEAREVLDSRA